MYVGLAVRCGAPQIKNILFFFISSFLWFGMIMMTNMYPLVFQPAYKKCTGCSKTCTTVVMAAKNGRPPCDTSIPRADRGWCLHTIGKGATINAVDTWVDVFIKCLDDNCVLENAMGAESNRCKTESSQVFLLK
jgi:hypothetical protein